MGIFLDENSDHDMLLKDLKDVIRKGSKDMPRSKQKLLGPSEIGNPCPRALAFKTMGVPGCNFESDPLAALFGTAFHTWFEWALNRANERLGRVRWISEKRVGTRVPGTCDLYDIDTKTVVDLKCPGPTRFARYLKKGPSQEYKIQRQIYGFGYEELGIPVEYVGNFFVPRAGQLSKAQLFMEPYDRNIAIDAMDRYDSIIGLCSDLDLENHPENYNLIPVVPSDDCSFCDYWTPNPQGPLECSGEQQEE